MDYLRKLRVHSAIVEVFNEPAFHVACTMPAPHVTCTTQATDQPLTRPAPCQPLTWTALCQQRVSHVTCTMPATCRFRVHIQTERERKWWEDDGEQRKRRRKTSGRVRMNPSRLRTLAQYKRCRLHENGSVTNSGALEALRTCTIAETYTDHES